MAFAPRDVRLALIASGDEGGKGGEKRREAMAEALGPGVAVTGGAGSGIGQTTGGDYEPAAEMFLSVGAFNGEGV